MYILNDHFLNPILLERFSLTWPHTYYLLYSTIPASLPHGNSTRASHYSSSGLYCSQHVLAPFFACLPTAWLRGLNNILAATFGWGFRLERVAVAEPTVDVFGAFFHVPAVGVAGDVVG
jgi:hypothetical protein